MNLDLLVEGGTVVSPEQGLLRAHIGVRQGKVVALLGDLTDVTACVTYDATGKHIFPGVVDPHVHIGLGNGLAEWETETRSAAIGGVTTILTYLMSGESYLPVIEENLQAAAEKSYVDYGFHVVPSTPVHLAEIAIYAEKYGIRSFKYFTSFRGDEGAYLGVQGADDGFLFRYLSQVARLPLGVANVHPENIEVVWELRRRLKAQGRDDLQAWNESRPDFVETQTAVAAAFYAHVTGCPLYIVHISGRLVLQELVAARERYKGTPLYIETCPHYLTHNSSTEIGSLGKVNPPLRRSDDVEALWKGLLDGSIDTVASDHVARKRAKKQGSIWSCSAGFPGSGTILSVLVSEGYHRRGMSLPRIAQLISATPAKIFYRYPQKGTIAIGSDADFAVVDLNLERVVTADYLQSHSDYSLVEGWKLRGWPVATFVRGQQVIEQGEPVAKPGLGKYQPVS